MSMPSLWFGLLLLLRAAFAQSAPNGIYPGGVDNEEDLIDKLATYVAMGRVPHPGDVDLEREDFIGGGRGIPPLEENRNFEFDRPIYSDFDLSDYSPGPIVGPESPLNINNMMLQQSLRNLPKQFGYKPDDVRFYMTPDEFPSSNSNVPAQAPAAAMGAGRVAVSSNKISPDLNPVKPPAAATVEHAPSQHAEDSVAEVHDQVPPHMKKSQEDRDAADGIFEPAIQPGNVLSSPHAADKPGPLLSSLADGQSSFSIYYVALVAALSSAGVVGLVGAGICWYRIHERVKAAAEVDYPAYGVTGPVPSKDVSPTGGDRKLAQSAHMYHYQHQKQQMAALQKSALEGVSGGGLSGEDKQGSDVESEDDNVDGDYTVYECPGLAPAGDMEVKNPLFDDEPTPATPSALHTELASEATE